MASFSISYIFKMVDQFTGPASKLGAAAAQMSKGVHQAGQGAVQAAGMIDKVGAAASNAASKLRDAASAVANYVREMVRAASVKPLAPMLPGQNHRGAAWAIAQRNAAEEAAAKKAAEKANAAVVSGGGRGRDKLTMTDMAAGLYMGRAAVHGVDHTLQKIADVDTMRRKLEFAWGSTPEAKTNADSAVAKAQELSSLYKNTTLAENLHILDDLRANLPEGPDHLINDYMQKFVKLHSFFKSWEGGKHAGGAAKSLKDISTAVRSGELGGNVTGEQMAKWAEDLTYMRAWFGDKFKLDEYFKAQKAARYSLPGTSDRFRTVAFPVMTQSMGVGAGVALATMYNKLVGGLTVHQSTAEAWRALGLVNMDQVELDKHGKIKPASIVGKDWIKGGELAKTDPDRFMFEHVLPAIARKGTVQGLSPEVAAALQKAVAVGDVASISAILPKFVKDPKFMQELMALGKDRNAIQAMYMLVERAASIARDAKGIEDIRAGQGEFDSYDTAKQRVKAQADRLLYSLTGSDFMGNVNNALNALANTLSGIADRAKLNDDLKNNPFMQDPEAVYRQKLRYDSSGKWSEMLQTPFAAAHNAELAQGRTPFQNFTPYNWYKGHTAYEKARAALWPETSEDGMWKNVPMTAGLGLGEPQAGAGRFGAPGLADSIPKSMSVTVEPIKVEPSPAKIEVNVTGTINGPVNGSGSGEVQFGSTTTRGTATPDAGAPAGQAE